MNKTYEVLREQWIEWLRGGKNNLEDPDVARTIKLIEEKCHDYLATVEEGVNRDCIWKDVSGDNPFQESGKVTQTCKRLYILSLGVTVDGSAYKGDTKVIRIIREALKWINVNWYNDKIDPYSNWWHWQVGAPILLCNIVILLKDELDASEKSAYINAIGHFRRDDDKWVTGDKMANANRTDVGISTLLSGIIMEDDNLIEKVVKSLKREFLFQENPIKSEAPDGYYLDGSCLMHGNIAYTAGYAQFNLANVISMIGLLRDSKWAFDECDMATLYYWIEHSYAPIIYKGAALDLVRGRKISRSKEHDHETGHHIIGSLLKLAEYAPADKSIWLKGMIKHWLAEDDFQLLNNMVDLYGLRLKKHLLKDETIKAIDVKVTNHQFPMMSRAVHHDVDFCFAISMYSPWVRDYTTVNGENLKGWYTGHGMTYLYQTDLSQYGDGFWPTVNPYRLAGTTVDTVERVAKDHHSESVSSKNWVGGCSISGCYGVTGMDLEQKETSLSAKKSWFMFGDQIICLGTDINSSDNRVIETIIENRKIRPSGDNKLIVNGINQESHLGTDQVYKDVDWLHMEGNIEGSDLGVYFPEKANVCMKRECRSGSWGDISVAENCISDGEDHDLYYPTAINLKNLHRINEAKYCYPKSFSEGERLTRNYLTLWIDHGCSPINESYSYFLLANKSSEDVKRYANNSKVTILENSKEAQGVKEAELGLTGVNFWQDGEKSVGDITSWHKSAVMVHDKGHKLVIAVSDPTMVNTEGIKIRINQSASKVMIKDEAIECVSLKPWIELMVKVEGMRGRSLSIEISK